ncbi:uncharacterized protein LACBIDRAFT_331039 [Laccaria bicolor S238N-H82]|uniref:Predicted protein n=1 Tax=Laccaria bicolor (strain S238N-H82 / ATCC MYA-4686) TaxID=486041 RepID=B0DN84_LACBS|nr:uncharacterized protein LACBIDRAFT_331039 [Laccaria bicolor S238N-H82]EDR03890.1 predicted protein [Laccaria bicolor S238N-H82]|eukprot:XP_001885458.1 predicted protein [Laccaria bicolor S238N-H82]
MAKAATAKGKGNAHAKAPTKAAPKKAAPKKTPATQHKKTGSQKRPAENESSDESSEESDHRRRKKKCVRPTEASDDEVVDAGNKDDKEPEVMGGEPESEHESPDDSECKKDLARDVRLVFTDTIKVTFIHKDNRVETLSRRCGVESERHSTLVATPPVSNIFVSITTCINNDAKKQMYQNIIGRSLERFGREWKKSEWGRMWGDKEHWMVDDQMAPGLISTTADMWSADTMKAAFLGVTVHWIDVKRKEGEETWEMRSEVIGFRSVSGDHNRKNLGSTLLPWTTPTKCETIEATHTQRNLPPWSAEENQLPCLGHVVNLAEVDVMTHITKIAAVETATAIWEYDPSLPDNRMLNGSLDVTAAIRTLAIKIQSSGQRIEAFEKLQIECGLKDALKIPLHSNV